MVFIAAGLLAIETWTVHFQPCLLVCVCL